MCAVQVTKLLGGPEDSELLSSFCSGTYDHADADLHPQVYSLIHRLILHIHENEPDTKKSILVFLPTYYALEKQWHLLKPLSSFFKVHILHSSIDTDQALLTMKIWKSHRKVCMSLLPSYVILFIRDIHVYLVCVGSFL